MMKWHIQIVATAALGILIGQAHVVIHELRGQRNELQQIRQHIETIKGDIPMSTLGN